MPTRSKAIVDWIAALTQIFEASNSRLWSGLISAMYVVSPDSEQSTGELCCDPDEKAGGSDIWWTARCRNGLAIMYFAP